jgi:hypothetical protein
VTRRRGLPALLALALAVVLSACGSSSSSSKASAPGASKKLTIGYSAWPGWFPLAVAEEKGIFKANGLDVALHEPVQLGGHRGRGGADGHRQGEGHDVGPGHQRGEHLLAAAKVVVERRLAEADLGGEARHRRGGHPQLAEEPARGGEDVVGRVADDGPTVAAGPTGPARGRGEVGGRRHRPPRVRRARVAGA